MRVVAVVEPMSERHYKRVGTAWICDGQLLIFPDDLPPNSHNCDFNGCGSFEHVIGRFPINRLSPDLLEISKTNPESKEGL